MCGYHSELSPAWDPLRSLVGHISELSPRPTQNLEAGAFIHRLLLHGDWKLPLGALHLPASLQCKISTLLKWTQLELTTAYPIYPECPRNEISYHKIKEVYKEYLETQAIPRTLTNQFAREAAPHRASTQKMFAIALIRKGNRYGDCHYVTTA